MHKKIFQLTMQLFFLFSSGWIRTKDYYSMF